MTDATADWGLLALLPLAVTLLLAFATRSAVVSMLVGVALGTLMTGATPGVGLNELFQTALGNANFIWICEIVMLIGILFAQLRRAGVLAALPDRLALASGSRRGSMLSVWGLGVLIIDDYFSPLMAGAITRPLTDAQRVSREKLAFLLDATTASVCILFPFAAWGAYMATLVLAQGGPVTDVNSALTVFIRSIPWNFYAFGILLFSLLIALRWLPDFGPMRRAEARATETGAVLRPGSRPLRETGADEVADGEAHLGLELLMPVGLVLIIATGGLLSSGSALLVEAFGAAVLWMFLASVLRRRLRSVAEASELIEQGVKDVVPALLVIALAYSLNAVAGTLGAGEAISALFLEGAAPGWLVPMTFVATGLIAFATGTSWGAFAIMMPVSLPAAYAIGGGEVTPLALQTIAAIAGGGIFGDNASPVSDTTVLASVGAGCDHMDHVITQLPYTGVVAALAIVLYVLL